MLTHSYTKQFKKLDKSKLDQIQIIQNPIVEIDYTEEGHKIRVGGDFCFVHYNRQKEIDHSTRKLQKRFRNLRKQQARCNTLEGDKLPNVTLLNREGESKS